ncbi:hypothetical protein ACOMHN_036744 [Nucella lapillus]
MGTPFKLLMTLALCILSREVGGKPLETGDSKMDVLTRNLVGLDKDQSSALSAVMELLDAIDLPSLCRSLSAQTPNLTHMEDLIARAAFLYDTMQSTERKDKALKLLKPEKHDLADFVDKKDFIDKKLDLINKKEDLTIRKADISNSKADLANTDFSNSKEDLTNSKADLTNRKTEFSNSKADLANTDFSNSKEDLTNSKADLTNRKTEFSNSKADLANTDFSNSKADLSDRKTEFSKRKVDFPYKRSSMGDNEIGQDGDNLLLRKKHPVSADTYDSLNSLLSLAQEYPDDDLQSLPPKFPEFLLPPFMPGSNKDDIYDVSNNVINNVAAGEPPGYSESLRELSARSSKDNMHLVFPEDLLASISAEDLDHLNEVFIKESMSLKPESTMLADSLKLEGYGEDGQMMEKLSGHDALFVEDGGDLWVETTTSSLSVTKEDSAVYSEATEDSSVYDTTEDALVYDTTEDASVYDKTSEDSSVSAHPDSSNVTESTSSSKFTSQNTSSSSKGVAVTVSTFVLVSGNTMTEDSHEESAHTAPTKGDRTPFSQTDVMRGHSDTTAGAALSSNLTLQTNNGKTILSDEANEVTSKPGNISNEVTGRPGNISNEVTGRPGNISNEGTSRPGNISNEGTSRPGNISNEGTSRPGNISNEVTGRPNNISNEVTGRSGKIFNEVTSRPGNISNEGTSKPGNISNDVTGRPGNISNDVTGRRGNISNEGTSKPGNISNEGTSRPGNISNTEKAATNSSGESVLFNTSEPELGAEASLPKLVSTVNNEQHQTSNSSTIRNTQLDARGMETNSSSHGSPSSVNFPVDNLNAFRSPTTHEEGAGEKTMAINNNDMNTAVNTDSASESTTVTSMYSTRSQTNASAIEVSEDASQRNTTKVLPAVNNVASVNLLGIGLDIENTSDHTDMLMTEQDTQTVKNLVTEGKSERSSHSSTAKTEANVTESTVPSMAESNSFNISLTMTEANSSISNPQRIQHPLTSSEDTKTNASSQSTSSQSTSPQSTVQTSPLTSSTKLTTENETTASRANESSEELVSSVTQAVEPSLERNTSVPKSVTSSDSSDVVGKQEHEGVIGQSANNTDSTTNTSVSSLSHLPTTEPTAQAQPESPVQDSDMAQQREKFHADEYAKSAVVKEEVPDSTDPGTGHTESAVTGDQLREGTGQDAGHAKPALENKQEIRITGNAAGYAKSAATEDQERESSEYATGYAKSTLTEEQLPESTDLSDMQPAHQGTYRHMERQEWKPVYSYAQDLKSSDVEDVDRLISGQEASSLWTDRQMVNQQRLQSINSVAAATPPNSRFLQQKWYQPVPVYDTDSSHQFHNYPNGGDSWKEAESLKAESFSARLPFSSVEAEDADRVLSQRRIRSQAYSAFGQSAARRQMSPFRPFIPRPNLGTLWENGAGIRRKNRYEDMPSMQPRDDTASPATSHSTSHFPSSSHHTSIPNFQTALSDDHTTESNGSDVTTDVKTDSFKSKEDTLNSVSEEGEEGRGIWKEASPDVSLKVKEEALERLREEGGVGGKSWSDTDMYGRLRPKYEGYACPGLFGFFGDVMDCRSFFICSWGVPYRFACPSGTLWNPARSVCDWSRDVTCSN